MRSPRNEVHIGSTLRQSSAEVATDSTGSVHCYLHGSPFAIASKDTVHPARSGLPKDQGAAVAGSLVH
jgi:hypothetical protein